MKLQAKMLGLGSPIMCFLLMCIWQRLTTAIPYQSRYYDAKCTDTETGRELYIGDKFTRPGLCVRVQCLGNLQLWEDNCQTPKLEGNCTQIPSANEFLDYPQCCPMYQCKTYRRNQNGQSEETRTYDHYGTLRKTVITQVFVIRDFVTVRGPSEPPKVEFNI